MSANTINEKINWIILKSKEMTYSIEIVYKEIKKTCYHPVSNVCITYLTDHDENRKNMELFTRIFDLYINDIARSKSPNKEEILNRISSIKRALDKKWIETDEAIKIIKNELKLD